jgi:hypothetical protein
MTVRLVEEHIGVQEPLPGHRRLAVGRCRSKM